MKQILIALIILGLIWTAQAENDKFGDTHKTKNIKEGESIYDIKGKHQLIEYYPELISNTYNCYPECMAEYVLINKVAKNIDLEDVDIEFFDSEGIISTAIEDYEIEFVESLSADTSDKSAYYIKPSEPKKIRITATKTTNEFVEWIPIVRLTKDKHDITDADEIILRNTAWAIWNSSQSGVTNGGISIYHMEDISGVIKDTLSGWDLTVTGTPTYNQNGKIGQAITFTGAGGESGASSTSAPQPSDFTMCAWVNSTANARDIYFSNGADSAHGSYMARWDNSKFFFIVYNTTGSCSTFSDNTITTGAWYHNCMTYNDTSKILQPYVNSIPQTPTVCTGAISYNSGIGIIVGGGAGNIASRDFTGTIDELKLFDHILTTQEISTIYNQTNDDPIALYHLDETSGTTATDSSGNGYTGSSNGVLVNQVGKYDKGYYFDGINDYVNSTIPQLFDSFTYSVWFKKAVATERDTLMSWGLAGNKGLIWELQADGDVQFQFGNGTSNNNVLGVGLATDTDWHHYVATYDGTTITTYMDTVSIGTKASSKPVYNQSSDQLFFGTYKYSNGYFEIANGTMDEIQIYERALNQSEITELFYDGVNPSTISFTMDSPFEGMTLGRYENLNVSWRVQSTTGENITNITANFHNSTQYVDGNVYDEGDYIPGDNITQTYNPNWWEVGDKSLGTWYWNITACDTSGACETSDTISFDVVNLIPTIEELAYPSDESRREPPVYFAINIINGSDGINNGTLIIWNETTTYNTYLNSTDLTCGRYGGGGFKVDGEGAGVESYVEGECGMWFPQINLPYGNYTWNAWVCDEDNDCSTMYPTNNSLEIYEFVLSLDTGGTCLTEKGFSYDVNVNTSTNYVQINLTELGEYIKDENMTNIIIDGADGYKLSNYNMVIDTVTDKNFTLYVGGFNLNAQYSALSPTINRIINLGYTDLTRDNNIYWVNIRTDTNAQNYNTDLSSTLNLKTQCVEYSPDTLNLKSLAFNRTRMLLTLKELPVLQVQSTSGNITQTRKITPDTAEEEVDFYLTNDHTNLITENFILNDFVGQYKAEGRLRVSENINSTISTVYSEPWYYQDITEVTLKNMTDYMVEVYVPDSGVENFGWFQTNGNGSKTLLIVRPILGIQVNHYQGLTYDFLHDYDAGTVGFSYEVTDCTDCVNSMNFTVHNMSGYLIYTNTLTTDSGSFSTSVPVNTTYRLGIVMDIENHSILSQGYTVALDYLSYGALKTFTLPALPGLGLTQTQIDKMFVWTILGVTAMFSSPATIGFVGIAMITELLLFYQMNFAFMSGMWEWILATGIMIFLIKVGNEREVQT